MTIRSLTVSTWQDFVSLMQTDSQCSECWCLNHREAAGCPTGVVAQEVMRRRTHEDRVGGLLAYHDQECVGWVAIDPMSELTGHDCQPSAKAGEWSIHCLFVKDGFRGRGVATVFPRMRRNFRGDSRLISNWVFALRGRLRIFINVWNWIAVPNRNFTRE